MSDDPAAFVGDIPRFYDRNLGPVLFEGYAAAMAERVAACAPSRVLETAAGTGILTRRLRQQLPASTRLTATDLNPAMLAVAAAKIPPNEIVTVQPADAMALPFADGAFDLVVCQFGIMFFPNQGQALREVRRVLVPVGRIHLSIWDSHRHNPFGRIVHGAIERLLPHDPPQFMAVPFSARLDPLKDALLEAGFDGIEASVLRRKEIVPDVVELARGAVFGSPLHSQIVSRGGIDPEQVVKALARDFEHAFGTSPARMDLQAIFLSAAVPA